LVRRILVVMRLTLTAIIALGFLAWDTSRNHGYYTRQLNAYLDDFGREVRRLIL
jgi:hypothetical protein